MQIKAHLLPGTGNSEQPWKKLVSSEIGPQKTVSSENGPKKMVSSEIQYPPKRASLVPVEEAWILRVDIKGKLKYYRTLQSSSFIFLPEKKFVYFQPLH